MCAVSMDYATLPHAQPIRAASTPIVIRAPPIGDTTQHRSLKTAKFDVFCCRSSGNLAHERRPWGWYNYSNSDKQYGVSLL